MDQIEWIAIVGSRQYPEPAHVRAYVQELARWDAERQARGEGRIGVVSGEGGVVDLTAKAGALSLGLPYKGLKPLWAPGGVKDFLAGKRRNYDIVAWASHVQCFYDGWSAGASHTVTLAVSLGLSVTVVLSESARLHLEQLRSATCAAS